MGIVWKFEMHQGARGRERERLGKGLWKHGGAMSKLK